MKGNAKPERWERGEQADARGEEEKGDKTRRRTKPRSAPPGAERTAPRYAAAPRARGARPHPRGRQRGGRSPQPRHHRPFSQPNAASTASLPFPPSLPPAPLPPSGPVPQPTCGTEQRQPHQQHQRRRFHSAARAAPPPASPRLPAATAPPRAHRPAGEAPVTSGRPGPAPRGSLVPVRPAASVGSPPALRPSGPLRTSRAAARAPTAERRRPVRLHSNDPRPWGGCAFRGQG